MTTAAVTVHPRRRALAETVELVSSMRFAITMLVMIAIASIIGTVIKQGEPMPNYINQFGPFWYEVFEKLGLYQIYSTWWFILILLFLIVSTTFCIIRNTPKMLRDMKSWKENVREVSLRNFHHKAEWGAAQGAAALAEQTAARLAHFGYKVKIVEKERGLLVAAKKGDEEKRHLSAFLANTTPKQGAAKNKDSIDLGKKIYRGGNAANGVAACASCHGANGSGIPAQYPRLAGQHQDYTIAQLNNFRSGARSNSVQMTTLAKRMSDEEIKAVADYIAGLK